jgi:hypothetical protein
MDMGMLRCIADAIRRSIAITVISGVMAVLGFTPQFIAAHLPEYLLWLAYWPMQLAFYCSSILALAFVFYRQHAVLISKDDRRALITQAREFISRTVRQNPDDIHFQNQLESDKIFSILRPNLSSHFNRALMGRVVLYPSRDGSTMPPIARLLIAEIERLEKEWGLQV